MIDGATRFRRFRAVVLPMVRGGVAATAVLCFIFSWTEFLLSLFLTTQIRTVPVKISTFVTSTGTEWGFISALGTCGHRAELHLHPARPEASGPRPHPRLAQGVRECPDMSSACLSKTSSSQQSITSGGSTMSFKEFDQKTYHRRQRPRPSPTGASPSASSCAAWRIAGVGFSAFAADHAGRTPPLPRPDAARRPRRLAGASPDD